MTAKKPSSSSRSGSPLTLLIVALISSTVFFLLGVVVGREYAIREGMVPVKEQVEETLPIERDEDVEALPRAKGTQGQERVKIDFYDQLEKDSDSEVRRVPGETKPEGRKPGKQLKPAPDGGRKTAPVRSQASAARKTGHYAIQVAAFRGKTNARQMAHALGRAGFNTHIFAVTVPGKGVFYRVWVGYYGTVSEASAAKRRLLQQTGLRISRATIVKR